jgi:hypothetical protein
MIGQMLPDEGIKKLEQALLDCKIRQYTLPLTEQLSQKLVRHETCRKTTVFCECSGGVLATMPPNGFACLNCRGLQVRLAAEFGLR